MRSRKTSTALDEELVPPSNDLSAVPLSRLATYVRKSGPTARGTAADQVASILREAILDGVLEPGLWLREMEVSREFAVSRTPIRDAFRTLASEGLLDVSANKGARVAPVTSDDIMELYTIRENLEGLAARLAARRATERQLEDLNNVLSQMKDCVERRDYGRLSDLDLRFHRVIRVASANRYLGRSLSQIEYATRRFRDSTYGRPGDAEQSLAEHGRLAAAIADRDYKEAERLAAEHMRRLAKVRFEMLLEGY